MRKTGVRRGIACLGAAVATAVLASPSCSAPSKGALIMSITTDMQTPKDISVIAVYVETNSVPKLDYIGRVLPDGTVSMPSTLAIVEPDDPSAQVRIRVIAFQEQKARVLRDVLTTVPHQRTALLRLPLDFLDDGSVSGTLPSQYLPASRSNMNGVPEGDTQFQPTNPDPTAAGFMKDACDWTQQQTMIDGACQDATVDSNRLPDYSDSEVFGDGGSSAAPSCFDVASCFAQSTVVASTQLTASGAGCSFSLPQGVDAADVNVALATAGTGTPVNGMFLVPLESDPGRGFSVQGQTVSLVPGVCNKLKAAGTQLVVSTSNTCGSKVEAAPVCEPYQKGGGSVDAGPPACSGSYRVSCPNAGTCTGPGCGAGQCTGGYVDVTISGTTATVTGAASVDGGGFTGSVTGTVNPATCTVNVDAPVGCDGGLEPWTFDLSNGTANVTYPGSSGSDTCGNLVMCSFTGCTATQSTPSPCDGTYVVSCPMTEGGCGGSPAEVVVSGSQATVYGANKDGGTLSGTVDTATCIATIAASNDCTSGNDTATLDLKTGAATVPCGNGGVCTPVSCSVRPGSIVGDGGGAPDSGGGCADGFTMCGNVCTDTSADPNNCGACGKVCVNGDICQNASCGAPPSDGGTDAGPVDASTDTGICVPVTCAQLGYDCGVVADGCGGVIDCGTCTAPEFCGGGGVNVCGGAGSDAGTGDGGGPPDAGTDAVVDACVPATCATFGYTCGPAADGCGGLIQCGTCQAPEFCGGGGFDMCGGDVNDASDACVPLGCAQQGFNCGSAGDGCGGVISCGTCNPPQTCGGGGVPGQCG